MVGGECLFTYVYKLQKEGKRRNLKRQRGERRENRKEEKEEERREKRDPRKREKRREKRRKRGERKRALIVGSGVSSDRRKKIVEEE